MPKPRVALTEDEALLWTELKTFRARGYAFRRQVPIGVFTADFLCRRAKLVVELDGNHHATDDAQWEHDRARDDWMRSHGYAVLRVWNADLRKDFDGVVEQIERAVMDRLEELAKF